MKGFPRLRLLLFSAFIIVSMAACESIQPGEPLIPAGDEKPGPGLFSGEAGEFKMNSDNNLSTSESSELKQGLDELDLKQTSEQLGKKIKVMEKQMRELEKLKLEVDKILQNQ